MYAGFKKAQICDSLNTLHEKHINNLEAQLAIDQEIMKGDSIRIGNLNDIVDMSDKEVRKQKYQKRFSQLLGIAGIIIVLLL